MNLLVRPGRWVAFVFAIAAAGLAGCRSADGEYLPDCRAFAGDELTLAAGRYEWDRFTDMRRADEAGNVVDPNPGFPKTGAYEQANGTLRLLDEGGSVIATWHAQERGGRLYLLNDTQQAAWSDSGTWPDCPLVRQGD